MALLAGPAGVGDAGVAPELPACTSLARQERPMTQAGQDVAADRSGLADAGWTSRPAEPPAATEATSKP